MTLVSINKVFISPICIKKKKIHRTGDWILIIPYYYPIKKKMKWRFKNKTNDESCTGGEMTLKKSFRSGSLSSLLQVCAHSCFIIFNRSLLSVDWRRSPGERNCRSTIWLPPSDDATQRNTTQPGAISGGAANIGGKTAFEPRRLPEEILSAGDISVCGRDLRAALPHYLLWLPVLHFLPLPLLPLILNSTAAGPAPPPPPPPPWLKTSAPF